MSEVSKLEHRMCQIWYIANASFHFDDETECDSDVTMCAGSFARLYELQASIESIWCVGSLYQLVLFSGEPLIAGLMSWRTLRSTSYSDTNPPLA